MDALDDKIAELLRDDGRASNRAIAQMLDVSPRLVGTRIDAMLRRKELAIAAVADIFAAGNDLMLAVGISVSGRATSEVADELAALDQVNAVNIVSGEFDLEILILSTDHETLRQLIATQVASIQGIAQIAPALTLELFKFERSWSIIS